MAERERIGLKYPARLFGDVDDSLVAQRASAGDAEPVDEPAHYESFCGPAEHELTRVTKEIERAIAALEQGDLNEALHLLRTALHG